MSSTTLNPLASSYIERAVKPSVLANFIDWCENQENDRLLWTGVALSIHGCILTPLTVIAVMLLGSSISTLALTLATISMVMVLVTNLAALPTKITIPVFLLSILIDLAVIVGVVL